MIVGESSIRVLLVEPNYYTRYPPLGLLKLSSLHKAKGDKVIFQRGLAPASARPSLIYITSLFTYSWAPVHKAAEYYRKLYPKAKIVLGGIYATLMPDHARLADVDEVHTGLVSEAERYMPDYSLVPEWESSILFATRGCIRKCAFCAVPRLEGKTWGDAEGIKGLVHPKHRNAVLWDNNILGVPNWREIVDELLDLNVKVDFNQGLDARLINTDVAAKLGTIQIRPVRMAYDIQSEKKALERAIPALEAAGFKRRQMIVYTLYNFTDTPDDFLSRVVDLLSWGVVSYPMRYEPLNSLVKNKYISPHWTARKVEMVARARRVMGAGGAFPPYEALLNKFRSASSFEKAFSMRDRPGNDRAFPEETAGLIETTAQGLTPSRTEYKELMNDPATLSNGVTCSFCKSVLFVGDRAFAIQDYVGDYVGYGCPNCHPNRKWINGLWRSVLGEKFSGNGFSKRVPLELKVLSRTVH